MTEEIRLLNEAALEIKRLRNQNALMNARLEMFDSVMALLYSNIAHKLEGFSPDLVFEIEKFVANEDKSKE